MLNRQRLILELLRAAGRPVAKLELMKWAFVISRETASRGGMSFYEFLPYHFGPYSFALQRDLEEFAQSGTIANDETQWTLLTDSIPELPSPIRSDGRRIADRFRTWSTNEVIDYVYRTYPSYTVLSKRERLVPRPLATPTIFTSGYEGLQIDGFLDRLVQSGIRRLIDVRSNPVARRFGFHRSTLERLTRHLEIEYVHLPELGIPSNERQDLSDQCDRDQLFDRYELITLARNEPAIERTAELMTERPSVLVCMESCHERCHRSRLATRVAAATGLPVVHLGSSHVRH